MGSYPKGHRFESYSDFWIIIFLIMPQFDFYSFSGQVFWSLTGFFVFYFFVLRFLISGISQISKIREKFSSISGIENVNRKKSAIYEGLLSTVVPK